jgi:hypothetical protein
MSMSQSKKPSIFRKLSNYTKSIFKKKSPSKTQKSSLIRPSLVMERTKRIYAPIDCHSEAKKRNAINRLHHYQEDVEDDRKRLEELKGKERETFQDKINEKENEIEIMRLNLKECDSLNSVHTNYGGKKTRQNKKQRKTKKAKK